LTHSKVYDVITDRILEMLDKGVVPWNKPWNTLNGMPQNLITKIPYKGVNIFHLACVAMFEGYSSPYWVSFKQLRKLGGRVKEDQRYKYSPVVFFMKKTKTIEEKVRDENGIETLQDVARAFWIARYYNVYNTDQCEGLEDKVPELKLETYDNKPLDTCEKIVSEMPQSPEIKHGGSKAVYYIDSDRIEIPEQNRFPKIEEYYSTLFHEMVHSTGHESRLSRGGITEAHAFGDPVYSKEELVAEMGAVFLCAEAGIENRTIDNSASYINARKKKLKDDKKCVVFAGSQAQKACEFILNRQYNDQPDENTAG